MFYGLEIEIDPPTLVIPISVFAVHENSNFHATERRCTDSYILVVKLGRMCCNRANAGVYGCFGMTNRGKKYYENRERENVPHLATSIDTKPSDVGTTDAIRP